MHFFYKFYVWSWQIFLCLNIGENSCFSFWQKMKMMMRIGRVTLEFVAKPQNCLLCHNFSPGGSTDTESLVDHPTQQIENISGKNLIASFICRSGKISSWSTFLVVVELGASLVIGSTLRQFVGFKGYDPPWPPIKCPILRDRTLPEYIIWRYIHQHQRWSRCPCDPSNLAVKLPSRCKVKHSSLGSAAGPRKVCFAFFTTAGYHTISPHCYLTISISMSNTLGSTAITISNYLAALLSQILSPFSSH